ENFINKKQRTFLFANARKATTNGSFGRNSTKDTTLKSVNCIEIICKND
ncbi:unnamed protein product, partial [Rotaria sp. Silwood2]